MSEPAPTPSAGGQKPPSFLALCGRREIIARSTRVALLVGTVLALINHGDLLFGAPLAPARIARILLTYCVPYAVATYASVQTLRQANSAARS